MSEELRYPLTYAFRPTEVYDIVYVLDLDLWGSQVLEIGSAMQFFINKASRVLDEQQGKDTLWIHIHHTYDNDGLHNQFRRIDYISGLAKWIFEVATTEIDETRGHYRILERAFRRQEAQLNPYRDPTPVEITLSYNCFWGNTPPTWL